MHMSPTKIVVLILVLIILVPLATFGGAMIWRPTIFSVNVQKTTTCIDSVRYFVIPQDGHQWVTSPKFDSKTLAPERC